jgi:CTP synthase
VYLSVLEAIKYSAYALNLKPEITYVSSQDFADKTNLKKLGEYDGVLVPGGFGSNGIEGKLNVIEYVRKKQIPYFGICYGMQLAVLEYAKNVLRLKNASTEEIDPKADHLVIGVMPDQKEKIARGEMGGSMRLGEYATALKKGSIVSRAYGARTITERHRHRYEVNPEYIERLTEKGLVFSGTSPDGTLMETMELPETVHPFFVGVQYHPEFHARPLSPHPLFTAFVKASYENKKE